jgi:uncharacterized protein YjbJ (UPF0337 family)
VSEITAQIDMQTCEHDHLLDPRVRNNLRYTRVLYRSPLSEVIVNSNQDKGIGKQVKGTVKDVVGKITGDKILEGEGKIEKGIGKVQKKVGDAQEPPPPRGDEI